MLSHDVKVDENILEYNDNMEVDNIAATECLLHVVISVNKAAKATCS